MESILINSDDFKNDCGLALFKKVRTNILKDFNTEIRHWLRLQETEEIN